MPTRKTIPSNRSLRVTRKTYGEIPRDRIAAKETASAKSKISPEAKAHNEKLLGFAQEKVQAKQKALRKDALSKAPSAKHIETLFGFIPATFKDPLLKNTSPPTEIRPDVPELGTSGKSTPTKYQGDRKRITKDSVTGEGEGGQRKTAISPKIGVCKHCGGLVGEHGWTPAAMQKNIDLRGASPEDIVHPRRRAGVDRPAHADTSFVGSHADEKGPRGPSSSAARLARAGSTGRASGSGDITKRNIEKPKKPTDESVFTYGEFYMSPNEIANQIIREAFTSGDRNNTTPNDNSMDAKGGTQRQMLAGEFFGSVAWPFDQTTNDMFDGSAELQMSQAHSGMGELVGGGSTMEDVGREIVDDLLEDSPSSIYSDPDSIGYLINELSEAGYLKEAETVASICEDAKEEDIIKVSDIIDKLESDKAGSFLIEQLTKFANQFLIFEEDADQPAEASDTNSPKDDSASKADDNKSET